MGKKNLTDKQWNKIGEQILNMENERNGEIIDGNKSVLTKLRNKSREMGFYFDNDSQLQSICFSNPNIFKKVLLDLYSETSYITEKEYLLRCLGSPQNKDLMNFYLGELHNNSILIKYTIGNNIWRISDKKFIDKYIELLNDNKYFEILSYVGRCLVETADLKYKDEYLALLFDDKIGPYKLYVVQAIGKLKLKEAIPTLIKLLDDELLCEFVLDALDRFKNISFLPYFEKYKDNKDNFIRSSAKNGIKTIEKILSE